MSPIPDAARCRDCDYLLRHLETFRCPECGRPFDPADPATMKLPAGVPASVLRRMQPRPAWNRWVVLGALWLGALAVLWGETALPGGRVMSMGGLFAFVFAAIDYPLSRLDQRRLNRRYAIPMPPPSPYPWRLILPLACLIPVGFLGTSRYLLIEARFAPFHNTFAAIYTQRPAIEVQVMDEWIGLWHVRRTNHYRARPNRIEGQFPVELGGGFVLFYTDNPNGSVTLVVHWVN